MRHVAVALEDLLRDRREIVAEAQVPLWSSMHTISAVAGISIFQLALVACNYR